MKSASIVILLPLMSVLVVSLYAAGGVSRTAALVLLAASVIGGLASFVLKRSPKRDR
jgi:positive regulator of sigma E activity